MTLAVPWFMPVSCPVVLPTVTTDVSVDTQTGVFFVFLSLSWAFLPDLI